MKWWVHTSPHIQTTVNGRQTGLQALSRPCLRMTGRMLYGKSHGVVRKTAAESWARSVRIVRCNVVRRLQARQEVVGHDFAECSFTVGEYLQPQRCCMHV